METKLSIRIEVLKDGFVHVEIDRQFFIGSTVTPAQTWGIALGPDSDLDEPLPCLWDGDIEQTPILLAEKFPAEYAYLKAKFGRV